jgi:hypothetical protein
MYRKYCTKIIFLTILLLPFLISCKYNSKNITLGIDQNTDNDLYNNICNYINNNREKFMSNGLKGIEFYNLHNEQEIFFNMRLDFFMAILNNNKEIKSQYYNCAKKYYQKFPKDVEYYYFWSKDVFDFKLFFLLKEQFGIIKLPMEFMHEYYREMDMFIGNDE